MNCSRRMRTAGRFLPYAFVIALMFTALPARAASVFYLDQSNRLPDGTNYLSVVLTENGSGGVDFLVQTLSPLNSIAGSNFGVQKFGFSFLDDTWGEISNLPEGWRARSNRRMDGFGKFDIRLQGKGNARTDSLNFTVDGVTIGDFSSLMSAHVAGFEWCRIEDERRHKCGGRDCATSAYFAGNMSVSEVPVSAAVWLFGSGLMGLLGFTRRRINGYRETVSSAP